MAKKRKGRQPNLPQEVLERAQTQAPTSPKKVQADSTSEPQSNATIDLRAEYLYVGTDLQRVGLLSTVIIIALVLLRVVAG